MGNNMSQQLKEEYRKRNFKILTEKQDTQLGLYAILTIKHFPDFIYIRKMINPNGYDQSANINDFVQNLSKTHKNICQFFFVEHNQKSKDNFDLIFEYGKKPMPKQKNLKTLWNLVGQIIEAMCFMESLQMHYPFLHKKYVLQMDKQTFKLINPYCFKDYLNQVLQIYMSSMKQMTAKRQFFHEQILQNIIQFGCMILSFLEDFDDKEIYQNPQYRKQCMQKLHQQDHEMFGLVDFIFDPNMGAKNFQELQEWFKENVNSQQQNFFQSILQSNLNPLQSNIFQSKNQPQNQPQQQSNSKKYSIFDNTIKKPEEIGKEMQKYQFKEESQHIKEELNLSQEDKRQSETRTDSESYSRRDSVNQQPLCTQENIIKEQNKNNITEYLKNQQQKQATQNLAALYEDDLEQNIEPNEQEEVAKYIAKEYHNNNIVIEENTMKILKEDQDEKQPEKIQQDQNIRKSQSVDLIETPEPIQKNQSLEKLQEPQEEIPQQNLPQQEPVQNDRNSFDPYGEQKTFNQIQRVMIKFDQESQKFVKQVLYKDGQTEIVEMDDMENQRYSTLTNQQRPSQARQPQVQQPQQQFQTMKIFLFQFNNPQPLLLSQSTFPDQPNDMFNLYQSIVDRSEPVKSSRYHQVEQEGLDHTCLKTVNQIQKINLKI